MSRNSPQALPERLANWEAVLTGGGRLTARHVIHTVGPIVRIGSQPDAEMLARCYRNSLALAADNGLRSIAFPAISTGAFCYPRDQAARVASETIEAFLAGTTAIERVDLVFYEMPDARLFLENHTFDKR